jgi:hypothetical protein
MLDWYRYTWLAMFARRGWVLRGSVGVPFPVSRQSCMQFSRTRLPDIIHRQACAWFS